MLRNGNGESKVHGSELANLAGKFWFEADFFLVYFGVSYKVCEANYFKYYGALLGSFG